MKKKLSIGILVVVIIVAGFIGFCMWFLSEIGSTYMKQRLLCGNLFYRLGWGLSFNQAVSLICGQVDI